MRVTWGFAVGPGGELASLLDRDGLIGNMGKATILAAMAARFVLEAPVATDTLVPDCEVWDWFLAWGTSPLENSLGGIRWLWLLFFGVHHGLNPSAWLVLRV